MRNPKIRTATQSIAIYAKSYKSWWVPQKSEPIHACKKFDGQPTESQKWHW